MQDVLKTNRTYKTRVNAVRALDKLIKLRPDYNSIRYVIAVNEEGRYAPIVLTRDSVLIAFLIHNGVTVANA